MQQKLNLLAGFTGTLTRDYAAPLARIDFADPERAAATINTWISARTHAKIPKLLTPESLEAAELVLTGLGTDDAPDRRARDRAG